MKKTLLTIATISLSVCALAQTKTVSGTRSIVTPVPTGIATPTTTVLQPASFATCTVTIYGAGADGYVAGTNAYDDKEKSQKYNLATYGLALPATCSGIAVGVAYVTGTGSVTARIYADNAGAPGALLGTSLPVGVASINTASYTPFVFASAVNITSAIFHVSLVIGNLNAAAGDTAVVAETQDACAANTVNGAYELLSDGTTWQSFTVASPQGWGMVSTDLAIFPQVTAEIVSVKNLALNSSNVSVSPNPTNGLVNVAVSLQNKENLTISVSNALGQVVSSSNFASISNETLSLDLSSQNNGVYFVSVSNGTEKTVKRIVLNK